MTVAREITQQELRERNAEVMRALDEGESFIVTREGVPVGELTPVGRPHFTARETVLEAFRGLPRIDAERFRRDVDALFAPATDEPA